MSDTETPENSGDNSGTGRFQKGADPRRAKGVKGRGGRPTNEFRESLRKLLDNAKIKKAVQKILSDPDHRQFSKLYATVVAQAHGSPTQSIDMKVGELPPFVVTVDKDVE